MIDTQTELKGRQFGRLTVRDTPPVGDLVITDCSCGRGVRVATRDELLEGRMDRCEYCAEDHNGGENGQ
jgi:hypothetical protein